MINHGLSNDSPFILGGFILIQLRDYQKECIEAIIKARDADITKQAVSLPTGTGKTITFAQLAKQLNVRTLILAHRDELISQAIDKISLVWPDVSIGKVKAETNEYTAQVVVASVQSAHSASRIEQLKKQNFQLMIIDECHHSTSESYRKIIDELQCPLLVGFTATMDRSDGVGLSNVFDQIIFERSLPTMINYGYLCDIKGQKIVTNVNLDTVKTVAGDFAVGQLSTIVNTPKRNRIVVEGYMKYAEGKKGIAFCADVQHSKDLAAFFNKAGVPAIAVYGDMAIEERKQALRDFKDGRVQILTNCNVLTEGFDEPSIEVVLMARPTKSRSMYIQMVGRGTRLFPNKQYCLVIDFFDSRQDICRLGTLAGKEVRDGQTLREAIREHEETQRKAQETAAALHTQEEEFDIMDRSRFKWFTLGTDYRLTLDKKLCIYLRKVDDEHYVAQLYDDCSLVEQLCSPLDLGYAMGIAEDYCRKQTVTTNLSDKTAPWRKKKATQSQKEMMRKYNIPYNSKTTAGEASDLIGAVLSAKQAWMLKPASIKQIQDIRKAGRKVPPNLTKGEAYRIIKSIQGN